MNSHRFGWRISNRAITTIVEPYRHFSKVSIFAYVYFILFEFIFLLFSFDLINLFSWF